MSKSNDKFVYRKIVSGNRKMVFIYGIILFITCTAFFLLILYTFNKDVEKENLELVNSVNLQTKKSLNNYLERLENTSKIFFSKKDYISYDAADTKLDFYNSVYKERDINDYLISLSLMDNYADFGVVYSNNHTVGNITDGIVDIYEGNVYQALSEFLKDNDSKWVTGYNNNYSRFIYLRRVNKNAVFVAAFFTTDLENVLLTKEQSNKLNVFITDKDNNIIYSDNGDKLGKKPAETLNKILMVNSNCSIISSGYAMGISDCGSDWKMVTFASLEPYKDKAVHEALIGAGLLAASFMMFMLIGFIVISEKDPEVSASLHKVTGKLDELTGLADPENFENQVADLIEESMAGSVISLILINISNLGLIKENYGRTVSDEALLKVRDVICDFYKDYDHNAVIGTTIGADFGIFVDFTKFDLFKAHDNMKNNIDELKKRLEDLSLDNDRGFIKTDICYTVYPDDGEDSETLLNKALKLLSEMDESSKAGD